MPSRLSGRFRGPVTTPIPGRQALIFPGRRETLNSASPGHSGPEHRIPRGDRPAPAGHALGIAFSEDYLDPAAVRLLEQATG